MNKDDAKYMFPVGVFATILFTIIATIEPLTVPAMVVSGLISYKLFRVWTKKL